LSPSSSVGRKRVFDGMQPQFEHSPPSTLFSMSATRLPPLRSVLTATSPPGPPPMITASNRSAISAISLGRCGRDSPCGSLLQRPLDYVAPRWTTDPARRRALRPVAKQAFATLIDRYSP